MAIRFFDTVDRALDSSDGADYPWHACTNATTSSPTHEGSARSMDLSGGTITTSADFNTNTTAGASNYAVDDLYLSFYLRRAAALTGARQICTFGAVGGATKMRLQWSAGNVLQLLDTSLSTIATGSTALALDTWYRIDLRCGTGATGPYELRINKKVELSGTADLNTAQHGTFSFANSQVNAVYVGDIVVRDDAFHAPTKDFTIRGHFPNGNGNYTAWTGDFNDVDEIVSDGSLTIISSSTTGDAETVTLGDVPGSVPANASVDAVMICAHIRKTAAPAVSCILRDRLSATDRDTAGFDTSASTFNASDTKWFTIYETKPGGGVFSQSDINGWEIGVVHNQAQSRELRCTVINANVLYSLNVSLAQRNAILRYPHLRM